MGGGLGRGRCKLRSRSLAKRQTFRAFRRKISGKRLRVGVVIRRLSAQFPDRINTVPCFIELLMFYCKMNELISVLNVLYN